MEKNLEISLDRNSRETIYMQLYNQIVQNITSGNLTKGDILPSSRIMAGTLGINFHTVNQAYQRLRENGIIALRSFIIAAGATAAASFVGVFLQ